MGKLRNPLWRQAEHGADVADSEPIGEEQSYGRGGLLIRLLGRLLGGSSRFNCPCRYGREFWMNLDGEAFGWDIEHEGDCIPRHLLDLVKAACLAVQPFDLWNADRPPFPRPLARRGVGLHFHQSFPSSPSKSPMIARAVGSGISLCQGTEMGATHIGRSNAYSLRARRRSRCPRWLLPC